MYILMNREKRDVTLGGCTEKGLTYFLCSKRIVIWKITHSSRCKNHTGSVLDKLLTTGREL